MSGRASSAPEKGRVHARSSVELQITLESESQFYLGFSENLSEGGVFVATYELRPVGTRLDISMSLPNVAEPIRMTGEVCWQRPYNESNNVPPGIGLRFASIRPEDVTHIREFLKVRAPLFFEE